jgi:hypothetical protein
MYFINPTNQLHAAESLRSHLAGKRQAYVIHQFLKISVGDTIIVNGDVGKKESEGVLGSFV